MSTLIHYCPWHFHSYIKSSPILSIASFLLGYQHGSNTAHSIISVSISIKVQYCPLQHFHQYIYVNIDPLLSMAFPLVHQHWSNTVHSIISIRISTWIQYCPMASFSFAYQHGSNTSRGIIFIRISTLIQYCSQHHFCQDTNDGPILSMASFDQNTNMDPLLSIGSLLFSLGYQHESIAVHRIIAIRILT